MRLCLALVGEEQEPRRIYSPGDVAERLGISSQRLRQLAAVFERVHGDLPRDERGARVWPEEGVEALELARELVQEGRAVGLEAALRGEPAPVGAPDKTPATKPAAGDVAALAELVEELRTLREAVEEQNRLLRDQGERLEALERENRELRTALPAGPIGDASSQEAELGPEPVPEASEDRPEPGPWRRVREWWRGRGT